MAVDANLFGIAYLDAENFRYNAELFGVGTSISKYLDSEDGNKRLALVLQAASRAVDTFCGRDFLAADKSESHKLDLTTWQFRVNHPPVISISACVVRQAIDGAITIDPSSVYINNQKGYVEITRGLDSVVGILSAVGSEIDGPIVEVTYKSYQDIPNEVKVGCGYQAGHMINAGYVDAMVPPNFGTVDLSGLKINNRKGAGSQEQKAQVGFSPEAERVLSPFRRFLAA